MYGFDLCDLSEYEMSIIMKTDGNVFNQCLDLVITAIQEVKITIIYVLIELHF